MAEPIEVRVDQPVPVAVQHDPTPWYKDPSLTAIAGFAAGLLSAIIIEFLKRRLFRPKLRIVGRPSIAHTHVPGRHPGKHEAKYVRVGVRNEALTVAKDCRAYLTEIAEWDGQKYKPVDFFADTLRLRWAYEGENGALHESIDIPKGIVVHFDVFSTKNERTSEGTFEEQRIVQVADRGIRYDRERFMNKIEYGKRYRFRTLVVAEGAAPRPQDVEVKLGANWSDMDIVS